MYCRLVVALGLLSASVAHANPLAGDLERRAPVCAKDNCARAVTGTAAKPSLSSRLADCNSFLAVVVTPILETTVATITVTTTRSFTVTNYDLPISSSPATNRQQKRDGSSLSLSTFTPTAIPTYASACSGIVRYDSACSCFGITLSTITASTSTSRVTATSTTQSIVVETRAPIAFCDSEQESFCFQGGCSCGIRIPSGDPICVNDGIPADCSKDGDCSDVVGSDAVCAGVIDYLDRTCAQDFDGTCPKFT